MKCTKLHCWSSL